MRAKSLLICAVSLYLLGVKQGAFAQSQDRCALPSALSQEISKKYAGASVITLADLDQYDRKLFLKDHGNRCPGLVRVDFYGDGKPTWAIVLISRGKSKSKAELFVAHKADERWEISSLETTDASPAPVVWAEDPGKYDDMWEPKTIHATNHVIVLCGYESWARLYAWTGKEVEAVQISD